MNKESQPARLQIAMNDDHFLSKGEEKMNIGTQKTIEIDGYMISLITNSDNHLSLIINHKDGSKVERFGFDLVTNDTQWGDKFSTLAMEKANCENNAAPQKSKYSCQHCGDDLTQVESVVREYISKDIDGDSVYTDGQYDLEGNFTPNNFGGFGGGNFDLVDDSDKCVACDGQL
jgi:hypothetical protein